LIDIWRVRFEGPSLAGDGLDEGLLIVWGIYFYAAISLAGYMRARARGRKHGLTLIINFIVFYRILILSRGMRRASAVAARMKN